MSTPTILNKFLPPWWENSSCKTLYIPKKIGLEKCSTIEKERTLEDCIQDIIKLEIEYTKQYGIPSDCLVQYNPFKIYDIPNIEDCIYDNDTYTVEEVIYDDSLDQDFDDEYVTDHFSSDSEDEGDWVEN